MARTARKKSKSGIYHVMLRGINRQVIFEDDADKEKFLETLKSYKDLNKYKVYAYCLMENHVHLLIEETEEPIGQFIKRICGSYVYWYNRKYDRIGHLFQDRFKSEVVEDDSYFLTVLRYIHQNPLRAGLVADIEKYRWSSYHNYLEKSGFVDAGFALAMFSDISTQALKSFTEFMNEMNEDICLDYEERKRPLDSDVNRCLLQYGISNISTIQQMEKGKRDEIIRTMKSIDGVSIRQLSRVTGISKSIIDRA
jgi:REP element-mobilizing transposase RayT